ncbi:MAG: glycosyltransferase family 9 protein [Acidobacteria bacterium]|nr:glycosyltransferase family 9 protein [Acidobacteriota bacterium]
MNDGFANILVIKLSALGDIVHAVPAVNALKRTFPASRLHWCVEAHCSVLVEHLACVDRVHTAHTRMWRRGKRWTGSQGMYRFIAGLRDIGFDVCLDFQGLLKSAVLARLSGSRERIGWEKSLLRESLARHLYTRTVGNIAFDTHMIEQCAAQVKTMGVVAVPWEFPFRLPGTAIAAAESFRQSLPRETYVLLNPGAGWPTKRWPATLFGELSRRMEHELNLTPVITYGPGEEPLLEEIRTICPEVVPAPLGLMEFMAICRQARCFVGGDTGPMHLASAVGTPVVAMFGPSLPSRNGPFAADDIVMWRDLPCAGSYRRHCDDWRCMDFTVAEVFAAVEQRIQRRESHGM